MRRRPGLEDRRDGGHGRPRVAGIVGDGDTHLACEDCNDGDADVCATPGVVTNVTVAKGQLDRAILEWSAPAAPGAVAVEYDTIRSTDPSDFVTDAECLLVADPAATTSIDGEIPASGIAFHYLVRATNACPIGTGPLGNGSDGSSRPAIGCP